MGRDALSPSETLVLKVASVLGMNFSLELLTAIFPVDSEKAALPRRLARLQELGLVRRDWPDELYAFRSPQVQEASYNEMLFAQRRVLHRQVAEWYESQPIVQLGPYFVELARHWEMCAEPARAIDYLEKAANRAREAGDLASAEVLLRRSVALETDTAVLSASFYGDTAPGGTPDWEGAMSYALSRLEHEISPDLKYHNLWHTKEDALPAVRKLAQMSRLSEEETRFVELGVVYHDLGFLVDRADHERAGVSIAAQVLPGFGFNSEYVALVQGMILATRIPQAPHTPLEEIVADADLDNLGRADCMARSEALRAENACFGQAYSEEEWCTRQLRFMLNHSYWTEAARELHDAGKRENIARLEARLAALREETGVTR
jgi:predicted metal-dependent HD superfamily phosphohydrolase